MARKKKEKPIIIKDYGEWNNIPEKWEDITLLQLQEINKLMKSEGENFNMYQCLHILCHKTKEEVEALPVPFFESICNRLIFLKTKLPDQEPRPYVEINGERYQVNLINDMTVAEYEATDAVLRTDEENLATILAILCRKPDEQFDKNFQDNILEKRIKMFEEAKITECLPVVNFFLTLWQNCETILLLHSEVQQEIDRIVNDIQNSTENGGSSLGYLKKRRLLRKLKKLKKCL